MVFIGNNDTVVDILQVDGLTRAVTMLTSIDVEQNGYRASMVDSGAVFPHARLPNIGQMPASLFGVLGQKLTSLLSAERVNKSGLWESAKMIVTS